MTEKIEKSNAESLAEMAIESSVDASFVRPMILMSEDEWAPACDIYETCACIMMVIELAGAPRDSLRIEYQKGTLEIYGQRQKPAVYQSDEIEAFHRKELEYGSFHLQLKVTSRIREEQIEAEFQSGLLILQIPKDEAEAAGRVQIDVKDSNAE